MNRLDEEASVRIRWQLEVLVRSGVHAPQAVIDELYDRVKWLVGKDDTETWPYWRDVAILRLREQAREEATWPEVTPHDRLERALARLDGQGFRVRQGLFETGTSPLAACEAILEEDPEAKGVIYTEWRDLAHAVDDDEVRLRFAGRGELRQDWIRVAQAIVAGLAREGLVTSWSGATDEPVVLTGHTWQRRQSLNQEP